MLWPLLLSLLLVVVHSSGNLAYTCQPGSPESKYPFCQRSLGFEKRAADLAGRLNLTEHVGLFFSYPGTHWIQRYNVKGWSLDHTCIHGVNKVSASVFPHAIAQGASWDLDLVRRVSNATAIEARILTAQSYVRSGGQNAGGALSCDGGPLANSAHDPRWGRISETYGEDPVHIQMVGVTAMKGLQNPQPVPGGQPRDAFMATRQVTRHYMGYHSGTGDTINGTRHQPAFTATARSLADSYIPTYGVYQDPAQGFADGIMCAMTELNGVPSCVDKYLMTTLLREQWKSDAIIQTDCCDSLKSVASFKYMGVGDKGALALSVNRGLGNYFGFGVGEFKTDMATLLANYGKPGANETNAINPDIIRKAGERVLLSHMRLGFYDQYSKDYPFHNASIPWDQLQGPKHQALAREATAKSTVLLKNDGVLPLGKMDSLAVIGPFAQCSSGNPKVTDGQCYLHSYNGEPKTITTILDGVTQAAKSHGAKTVQYSLGSNATCTSKHGRCTNGGVLPECWKQPGPQADAIAHAAETASQADVTILALGLGVEVEAEGCDRFHLDLPGVQKALLTAVGAKAKKLIVVVVSAGGVDMDESTASAVLWAPYGGEAAGSGLVDVLWGTVNPSAKMPVTVYSQEWATKMNGGVATSILAMDLEVGLGRTYRYLKDKSTVKHHFGYGLSYTHYKYTQLTVDVVGTKEEPALKVTVTVQNVGHVAGREAVQVYVKSPSVSGQPTPLLWLAGFSTVDLGVGSTKQTMIAVNTPRLETAMKDGSRTVVAGTYTVWVGGHQPGDKEGEAASGPCLSHVVTL